MRQEHGGDYLILHSQNDSEQRVRAIPESPSLNCPVGGSQAGLDRFIACLGPWKYAQLPLLQRFLVFLYLDRLDPTVADPRAFAQHPRVRCQ